MNPCGFVSRALRMYVSGGDGFGMLRLKSSATSGPLTVSSHVIHEPHGMAPPAQLPIVPFRLVKSSSTSPCGGDQHGGRAAQRLGVVGRARAEGHAGGRRAEHLVVADQPDVAVGTGEGGHAVVATGQAGAVVEDDRRAVGVVERAVRGTREAGAGAPCRRAGRPLGRGRGSPAARHRRPPRRGSAAAPRPAPRPSWPRPLAGTHGDPGSSSIDPFRPPPVCGQHRTRRHRGVLSVRLPA